MVLESAYFHPPSVRRTSKRLGLKTEASIRFERGGDIEAPPVGIARAAALFEQMGAGRASARWSIAIRRRGRAGSSSCAATASRGCSGRTFRPQTCRASSSRSAST